MRKRLLSLAAALVALVATVLVGPATPAAAAPLTKVLVFSKTAGFRHSSIPNGIAAIQALGSANGFTVTATEDATQFNAANLAQYQAVVWLMTTGDVLDATQQTAFQNYIAAGGGYVGVHAAADTEYDWPWYGGLVGAYFSSHPAIQTAQVRVETPVNASTAHLPSTWSRSDEWYNYRTNPRPNVRVLMNLNEASYTGGTMGDHPITWCQNYGGGRSWYTGLGHTEASYTDTNFTKMLLGGLQIAAGSVAADCTPTSQPPVTGATLKARANSKFVTAPGGGTGNLIAGATTAATLSERYDIVDLGGGNIALKSRANGKYVCADNAGANPLIANRTAVGPWETFARIVNSDGTISLRAQANGKYVVAENAGAAALIANRTAIGTWEKFDQGS
ncbi:ThuA domain-containing protein [Catellatospora sp. KI3]|uniref:ThuA domain-containing protein n=1 Tax=Catellatospora sp. KI3 TaxID=3041620 RepID=UPI0024825CAD|nr:ThuA domain-containing protein [Catellatospora sp. KI3]MDI1465028.1 ThuA domain-containing protein [Catellatospora sp. KI3]